MRKIIFPLFSIILTLLVGCKTNDTFIPEIEDPEISEEESESPYNKLLIGDWHFFSGDFINILDNSKGKLYDQILSFNQSKNFSEKNVRGETQSSTKTIYGNWTTIGNQIRINDWDGNYIDSLIYIDKLTENELTISYQRYRSTYKRVGHENYSSTIVGVWNKKKVSSGKEQEYIKFTENGDMTDTKFIISFLNPTYYTWVINGNTLTLQHKGYNSITTHNILYCNKYYLQWEDGQILTYARKY